MNFSSLLRNVIEQLQEILIFRLFYWFTRISMAITSLISGYRKFPGTKFTILPVENPVGAYFNAMFETGFYWNSIGYFQVFTGLLLLWNRTTPVASLMMLPVTLNIFLVSISLNMKGTPLVTTAMVLANIFLILWHNKNISGILSKPDIRSIRLK